MPTSPIRGCRRLKTFTSPHIPATNSVSPLSWTQPIDEASRGGGRVADHRGLRRQRDAPRSAASRRCSAAPSACRRPHRVAGLLSSMMPAARSTESPSCRVRRRADGGAADQRRIERRDEARALGRHGDEPTRGRQPAPGRRPPPGRRPVRATIARNLSSAAPEASASRTRASASSSVAAFPASRTMRPPAG